MTATFGKLQGRSLELGDGLNLICAPNEGGKVHLVRLSALYFIWCQQPGAGPRWFYRG